MLDTLAGPTSCALFCLLLAYFEPSAAILIKEQLTIRCSCYYYLPYLNLDGGVSDMLLSVELRRAHVILVETIIVDQLDADFFFLVDFHVSGT